jgi:hypothetical protein
MDPGPLKGISRKLTLERLWSKAEPGPIGHADLIFKCSDGSVGAHKAWVVPWCSTLSLALQNTANILEEILTVLVPDFSVRIVRKFLEMSYTGKVWTSRCQFDKTFFSSITDGNKLER